MASGYCEPDDVMAILQTGDEALETEIEGCITSADALVDALLKQKDLSVPASVPQVIKDASAYFAAWLFRRRRDPTGAEAFWQEATRFIDVYVETEGEVAFKAVTA